MNGGGMRVARLRFGRWRALSYAGAFFNTKGEAQCVSPFVLKNGGKGRDRTGDARIFSPSLYQLSYPATGDIMVNLEELESPTFWSVARRSIQLSYRSTRSITVPGEKSSRA